MTISKVKVKSTGSHGPSWYSPSDSRWGLYRGGFFVKIATSKNKGDIAKNRFYWIFTLTRVLNAVISVLVGTKNAVLVLKPTQP